MNIKEEFEEFICEKYNTIHVPNKKDRIETMIGKLIEYGENDCISKIDEYIIANKSIHMRTIQKKFYDYLEKKYNKKIDTKLDNVKLNILPKERQIDILKNFHRKTSQEKMAKRYDVSERTIYEDLDSLEKGIVFLGTEIKVNLNARKSEFEDTVHPIFLALNLTEVNLLMNFLPKILKEYKRNICNNSDEKKKINLVNGIVDRMKIQLSDYAIEKLNIELNEYDRRNIIKKFNSEKNTKKLDGGYLAYLEKAENSIRKILVNGSRNYEGYIKYDEGYYILTIDNEIVRINIEEDDIKLIDEYE